MFSRYQDAARAGKDVASRNSHRYKGYMQTGAPTIPQIPGEIRDSSSRGTTDSSPVSSGVQMPDHELLRVIGRGAYGEVWLARHNTLGTFRAVKIVRRDSFGDENPFQREFNGLRKYEPISRGHPNLMAILHVGGTDDCFYCVMELADDGGGAEEKRGKWERELNPSAPLPPFSSARYMAHTLRSELKQNGSLPIDRCLEIGHALASALAHLHAHKLVHRDVKPSNVIFVGGVAKLADIGLVAGVDEARSLVGTKGYTPLDGLGMPSADCYALGKLLYELSTGHDRTAWPEPAADLATRPDRERLLELNAILHRACAPDPRERYANGDAMCADLRRLSEGKSVRRSHRSQRRWNLIRRATAWLAATAGVVALLTYANRIWQPEPTDYEGKDSPIPEAKELFELGQHAYEKKIPSETRLAIHHFEAAIRADTNFAKAYAWLAASQCWGYAGTNRYWEFLPLARLNAEHALALDPRLAKAHLTLAWYEFHEKCNWREAENYFRLAQRYAPRDPESYEWRALVLNTIGRTQEALESLNAALRLRSDSISAKHFLGGVLATARRYDEAIAILRTVTEMEPSGPLVAYSALADVLINSGRFDEGIEVARIADIRDRGVDEQTANEKARLKLAAVRSSGAMGYWQLLLDWEEADFSGPHAYMRASLHARLGHTSKALEWLEQAAQHHDTDSFFLIKIDPSFDSLRSYQRFSAVVKELGLPE